MRRFLSRTTLAIVAVVAVLLAITAAFVRSYPSSSLKRTAVADMVVTVAGDIAEGSSTSSSYANATKTGDLVRTVNPVFALTVGDNAYPDGSTTDYANKYDPTWGSFGANTRPAPGNHDYHQTNAQPYQDYFASKGVTVNSTGQSNGGVYYAYNIGPNWRAYSLNGDVSHGAGSAQELWLKADLAANPGKHYIAYAHEPRYNSGTIHGDDTAWSAAWTDLQNAGGDIWLFGHEHSYQRFTKMDGNGNLVTTGMREFLVGTGGNQLYALASTPHTGLEYAQARDYGVVKLTLSANSYSWQFLSAGRMWNGSTSVDDTANPFGTVLDTGTETTNVTIADTSASPSPSATVSATPSPSATSPSPSVSTSASPPPPSTTLHYTANESGSYATPHSWGFNLHDTSPGTDLNTLPTGDKAVVWMQDALGGKCPSATLPSAFTTAVQNLKNNDKVYAYYLVDEPSDTSQNCIDGMKAAADYIHANAPGQKAFILLTDYPGTYAAYKPANTDVDLVALDPYPCLVGQSTCNYADITNQVNAAESAGIPRSVMVPVFQAFGDSTWRAPSTTELQTIYDTWAAALPNPVFDYAYTWGCQNGARTDCIETHPEWQTVIQTHNTTSPSPSPTPSPTSPSPSPTSPSPSPTSPSPSQSPSPTATPQTLVPVADVYVRGNGTQCGTCTTLQMKNSPDTNYDRKLFLKFNLPTNVTSVTRAELRMYLSASDGPISAATIYPVSNDTWTEAMTWATAPTNSGPVAATPFNGFGQWYTWDITATVNATLAGDDTQSLLLYDPGVTDKLQTLSSREGANPPQLVLTP